MTDWLGVSLEPLPQAALCRCGFAAETVVRQVAQRDRLHAAKAHDRVPIGSTPTRVRHLTVTDNRGICRTVASAPIGRRLRSGSTPSRSSRRSALAPTKSFRAARDCPSGALGYALDGRDPAGVADQDRERRSRSQRRPVSCDRIIELLDASGNPEPRNTGASREHYSLCRCGKSQNKPFCSGMHWYADFHDPPRQSRRRCFSGPAGSRRCCGSRAASTRNTSRRSRCSRRCSAGCHPTTRSASLPGSGRFRRTAGVQRPLRRR